MPSSSLPFPNTNTPAPLTCEARITGPWSLCPVGPVLRTLNCGQSTLPCHTEPLENTIQGHLHFIESTGNFPTWPGFLAGSPRLMEESLGHCQKRSQVSIWSCSLLCFDLDRREANHILWHRARFTNSGRGCALLFRGDCLISLSGCKGEDGEGHGNRQQALRLSDLISGACFRIVHLLGRAHMHVHSRVRTPPPLFFIFPLLYCQLRHG